MRLVELDPRYVDVIVRRWHEWTGNQAVRAADRVVFDELAARSAADQDALDDRDDEYTDLPSR